MLRAGSGGKDSVLAAHILKYKFNMNPLTVTWPPILYTHYGLSNFKNWLHKSKLENISAKRDERTMRILTKLAILNLMHPFQTFMLGQKNFPIKIIKYEDLQEKTFSTFKDLIIFIDKTIGNKNKFNKKKAINSIKSTSFDKLKNIEKSEGFEEALLSKEGKKNISFFHLGPKNDWKKVFDENYQKKLNLKFNINLKELDYI